LKLFYIIILLTNLIFAGCAGRQSQGLTIREGVLSVGVEINYPPMEYYDTDGITPIGFNIDLTRALADRLGLEVNFIDTAWEGIFAGLDTNRYDIALNITILPERQKRFNFTRPYIDSSIAIVVLNDSGIIVNEPQDIAGFRASFQGNTTAQYFTERLAAQGVSFTSFSYDKIISCFSDLRLGRVDFVVADNIVAFHYAQMENSPFRVAWVGPSDEFIAICLRKGNDELTEALNNAIEELFNDGVLAEISYRYFNYDMVSPVRYFVD
jgi:polar amino acid transport system substrate-binding protein